MDRGRAPNGIGHLTILDLVNFRGKKIVYMLKMEGFEMGTNKIWIKW